MDWVYFLPQLSSIFLYAFFVMVDLDFGLDAPFSFLALMLFTREFFTPSLFFLEGAFFFGISICLLKQQINWTFVCNYTN